MALRHIFLIRHGQYHDSVDAKPALKGKLNAQGKRQARLLGRWLAANDFDVLHVSTMPRAQETAAIALATSRKKLELRSSKLLREGQFKMPRRHAAASTAPLKTIRLHKQRADRAFARHFKPTRGKDKHEAIICHGNLIRYLLCRALRIDPLVWTSLGIHHTGVCHIVIGKSGYAKLVSYNVLEHLPLKLRSE